MKHIRYFLKLGRHRLFDRLKIKGYAALLVLALCLIVWDVAKTLDQKNSEINAIQELARAGKIGKSDRESRSPSIGNVCGLYDDNTVDVRFDSNLNAPYISIDKCVATFQYMVPPDVRGKIMPLSEPTTKPIAQFHNLFGDLYKLDFPVFERVTMHPANERDSASVGYNDLERCPKLFIIPLLNAFGRTHNQIQALMNMLLLSKKLGRTVVLPPLHLYRNKKQYSADGHLFLDMGELGKQFCVVSHTFFLRYLNQQKKGKIPLALYHFDNYKYSGKSVSSSAFLEPYLHNISSGEAAEAEMLRVKFTARTKSFSYHLRSSSRTVEYLMRIPPDETIVAVQSEMAFFCPHPAEDMIRGFRHLKPSSLVAAAVKEQLNNIDKPFVGFHTRHREGTCYTEVTRHYGRVYTDDKPLDFIHGDGVINQVLEECRNDLDFLLQRYNSSMHALVEDGDKGHEKGIPVFMATDGQQSATRFQDLLLKHYPSSDVHLYKEDETLISDAHKIVRNNSLDHSLLDETIHLFVDYFVAAEATFFWGNTLSSFSQNVVFKRLAEGRECNGLMLGYYFYMFRL
ncbi:GDP-fucose protein O-fucosyltransferase, putative [Angomonas deanei]|uniref:GDP-fucose protein O-fucosyltransferase, putative n=1 Tax=Angomonas deanei TaxID=59799 RepID=A0A7G2CLK2_9TRYP|nr:GDP-fucose protein O-fucosyltransferase, putative [Angomonas deanei]